MSCISHINPNSTIPSCCDSPKDTTPQWFCALEKITAVGLAVFAYLTDTVLFIPFFLVGSAIGFYQALTSDATERESGARMGCSRGLMEQLTAIKLPRVVSLATDVAVMWCHIDHHSIVFVPMIALYSGAKLALEGTTLAQRLVASL